MRRKSSVREGDREGLTGHTGVGSPDGFFKGLTGHTGEGSPDGFFKGLTGRTGEGSPDGFFSRVYEVTKLIPYGRITSYGAIARYLGSGGSARMVGWALNSSHTGPGFIPAHRVVNRNGILTGKHHFGTSSMMQQLLENEGFTVEEDRVVEFRERFWDPAAEL